MAEESDFYRFTGTKGYIVSRALVEAVNCAIALERPLLAACFWFLFFLTVLFRRRAAKMPKAANSTAQRPSLQDSLDSLE